MTAAHSKHRSFVSVLIVLTSLAWDASTFAQTPQWIWPQEKRWPNAVATWRKSVTSPAGVQQAQLSGVADYCRMSVRLNGREVATVEGFDSPFFVDVTRWIHEGDNLLEVHAISEPGPAAMALRLEMTPAQGNKQIVVTEKSWSSTLASGSSSNNHVESAELGEVREFELDPQRQFGITAVDDYDQWKQALQTGQSTDPSSFLVVPGFEIELIRSAGKVEGSWISMAFDPRGRIVIGLEERGLLRMTLAADGHSITKVETVNDTLLECRGLLFAHDSLYANANNSKGLYRLRDSDGDDQFDEVKLLRQFEGGVGHGRNDLALGPDGMIYLIHGDSVDLPTDFPGEDWTSPFREHRRGQKSHEGHVLRTDHDGRQWQLLTAGLRNPYGIAFNADGEMFTYDADAEFDMGSPWYRPTQVKHLVPGGDFGWRGVTGRWPPYYPDHPDNAQPSVHIGKGSPTSVKFGFKMGSRFPPPYRDALFILDWSYGRIIAVHLTPRGASYTGRPESFLKGRPLNVTDLDFGPDGAMYFVTGGRKTQAGLYRVRYVGSDVPPTAATTQQRARQRYSAAARSLRHELEARLVSKDEAKDVLDAAWPHLDSPDPSIRYAARMAVERQPIATWQDRALGEEPTTASLAALLALARSDDPSLPSWPSLQTRIVRKLNDTPLEPLTNSHQVTALYIYQLCLANKVELDNSVRQDAINRLDAIYPSESPEVNRYLSLLLGEQDSPSVVSKTIPLLAAATDQAEQLHYLFAIRKVQSGWTPSLRQGYVDGLRRSALYLGGEGMPGFLKQIRADFLGAMSDQEREQFAALIDPQEKSSDESEPLPQRPFVRQWTMDMLEDVSSVAGGKRDLESGSRLFAAALCARCHRVGNQGQLAGPDLTGVSRRFARRDILRSIVDPSLVVAENYHVDRIVTTDGRIHIGRIVQSGDFRSPSLRIVPDPLRPDQFTEIVKRDIESHSTVPTSPMPAGLLDTLTKDEIADLLAFIESGGTAAEKGGN